MTLCRLCHHVADDFITIQGVVYLKCPECGLRFMAEDHLPNPMLEKAHYDHHENDIDDQGYQLFLSRLLIPLKNVLPKGANVLDFGSGPSPANKDTALASMMRADGYRVFCYDPFYHDDRSCLDRDYDAVTATEVIEHFHYPRVMFDQLERLLRPGGVLALMTTLQTDDAGFADWHYQRDPTHVTFYREESFCWLADYYGYDLLRPHRNVALFQKPVLF